MVFSTPSTHRPPLSRGCSAFTLSKGCTDILNDGVPFYRRQRHVHPNLPPWRCSVSGSTRVDSPRICPRCVVLLPLVFPSRFFHTCRDFFWEILPRLDRDLHALGMSLNTNNSLNSLVQTPVAGRLALKCLVRLNTRLSHLGSVSLNAYSVLPCLPLSARLDQ